MSIFHPNLLCVEEMARSIVLYTRLELCQTEKRIIRIFSVNIFLNIFLEFIKRLANMLGFFVRSCGTSRYTISMTSMCGIDLEWDHKIPCAYDFGLLHQFLPQM